MNLKKKILIAGIALFLLAVSLISGLESHSEDFVTSASEKVMASVGLIVELKILLGSLGGIPVIGSFSESLASIFDSLFHYASISGMLILLQLLMLALSQSMVLKVVGVLLIAGLFLKKYELIAFKWLLVLLVVCPGLSLYVSVINYATTNSKLDLGSELHQTLTETHQQFVAKQDSIESQNKERVTEQLKKQTAKGKNHLNIFQRIEDKTIEETEKVGAKIGEDFKALKIYMKAVGKKLVVLVINTLVNILLVFLVLPLGYFYGVKMLINKLFKFNLMGLKPEE
jgi:hypothetical protein